MVELHPDAGACAVRQPAVWTTIESESELEGRSRYPKGTRASTSGPTAAEGSAGLRAPTGASVCWSSGAASSFDRGAGSRYADGTTAALTRGCGGRRGGIAECDGCERLYGRHRAQPQRRVVLPIATRLRQTDTCCIGEYEKPGSPPTSGSRLSCDRIAAATRDVRAACRCRVGAVSTSSQRPAEASAARDERGMRRRMSGWSAASTRRYLRLTWRLAVAECDSEPLVPVIVSV
jgi:hypothetical protein